MGTIPGLSNVYTKKSIWCSLVLITNLAVDPHCAVTDCKDGWVFVQVSGDFLMMRSSISEHYVVPWAEGNHISCFFWMHEGMFNRKTLEVIQTGRPVPRPREQLPIMMQTRTSLPELMVRLQTGPQELVACLRLKTPTCCHPNSTRPRLTWTLSSPEPTCEA